MNLAIGQSTHPGRARESNEDAFCVIRPPEISSDLDALLAVADGMGGHQAGEVASRYVTSQLRELFSSTKYREWVSYDPNREDYDVLVVKEVLEQLNDRIHEMSTRREDWHGMGTTATLALLRGTQAYIGHVGDSRAYLFSRGNLRQLTADHTWWIEQVQQGLMTVEQATADSRKNRLTRALGVNSLIRVDRLIQELNAGDALILCTDGLTNMVTDGEILNCVTTMPDPQQACHALVQLANHNGGGDNITIVIGRVIDLKSPPSPPEPNTNANSGLITQSLPVPRAKARNSHKSTATARVVSRAGSAETIPGSNTPAEMVSQPSKPTTGSRSAPRLMNASVGVIIFVLMVLAALASGIAGEVLYKIKADENTHIIVAVSVTGVFMALGLIAGVGLGLRSRRRS